MTGFGDLNLEFPLILAILLFMSSLNFMLRRVEHEKSFITSTPVLKIDIHLNLFITRFIIILFWI